MLRETLRGLFKGYSLSWTIIVAIAIVLFWYSLWFFFAWIVGLTIKGVFTHEAREKLKN